MELHRGTAADAAGVRQDRAEIEVHATQDAGVGVMHVAVGLFQGSLVQVEGVGILHEKLPGAQHAEAGPGFIAKLGLYLVVIDGQLFVASKLATGEIGDDLLVGWPETEIALVSILDLQQQALVVLAPASGFVPEFSRLDDRQHDFLCAGSIHLLTNDVLYLLQYTQSHGHPAVDARCELANQAGPDHQLMANDFRVCRCLFQGGNGVFGSSHSCLSNLFIIYAVSESKNGESSFATLW